MEGEPETVTEKAEEGGDGEGTEEKGDSSDKAAVLLEEGSGDGDKGGEESGESKPDGDGDKDAVDEKAEGTDDVGGSGEPGSKKDKEGEVEQKQEEGDADKSVEDNSRLEAKRVSVSGRMSILQEEPEEGVSEVTLLIVGEDGQPPSHIRDLQSRAMSISKARRLSGESLHKRDV